jgi:hypothetical protein
MICERDGWEDLPIDGISVRLCMMSLRNKNTLVPNVGWRPFFNASISWLE